MRQLPVIRLVIAALLILSMIIATTGAPITASISTGPSTATYIKDLEEEGFMAIANENWTDLLNLADRGLALEAENPVFYAMKGYAYRKLGNLTAALSADTRAIEIEPNPIRYANRGMTHLAMVNYSAALSDGKASVSLDPGYATAYALEAMAYLGMQNTSAAQEAIDKALAIDSESASHWHVQGLIALKAGNCTRAIESLERSVLLNPNYSLPWPGMPNASTDLKGAEAQCRAGQSEGARTNGIPLEGAVVALAAAAVFLLAGRK